MKINWFPGHMKKTFDLIKTNLKLVDCVVELVDARVPYSSSNPLLKKAIERKPVVIAINKCDLADPVNLKLWENYYSANNIPAVRINSKTGEGVKSLLAMVEKASSEVMERMKEKNRINRRLRLMIVGVPNVGKSTLINRLSGKKSAQTGNKPGVTKGKQWIRLSEKLELLDTPGVLWHDFENETLAMNLACTGAIKDDVLPLDDVCLYLVKYISEKYPNLLEARFKVEGEPNKTPLSYLDDIAKQRGLIKKGADIDYERAIRLVIDEFRKGIIGRISLETPDIIDGIE